MVKADVGKDEAGKLKEQLETVGGICEIEWNNRRWHFTQRDSRCLLFADIQ